MASSTNASVKPGSFVVMVVILTNVMKGHTTTSNTPTDNLTFESSCAARSWSAAVTDCINKGAAIFTLKDLITSIGGTVLKKAENEHTKIWIHNNGTCWTAFNDTFQASVCSDTNYYVCKSRTRTSSNWYVQCPNTDTPTQGSIGSTVSTGSAGSTVSTSRNHTTRPEAYTTVTIITTVTCVIVALVAVLIITVCYIINRNKKPIKYAVRAESAMYHRQHPDPGKVEEPQLADVQLICPTEADGGNSGMNVSL